MTAPTSISKYRESKAMAELHERFSVPPRPGTFAARRQPRWIERMQQGQTKAKDLTGPGPDAA